jgi:hypothetical protein
MAAGPADPKAYHPQARWQREPGWAAEAVRLQHWPMEGGVG